MLAVLLVGICGISAIPQNEFHYTKMDIQTDKCNVCYNLRWTLSMDKARCKYYSLASDITGNNIHDYEPQNEIIDEVDDMIFEYTEKASNKPVYNDCIPLLSQYTNCNRDNICTGCKTCNCDSEGRWNCSQIQHCRPDPVTPLNHHTLVVMMEKLNDYKDTITNSRHKRSVVEGKEIMSPEEVLKWMYGVKRFDTDEDFPKPTTEVKSNSTNRNAVENINISWSDQNEKKLNESESQPLLFEDLLNNLNLNDDKIHISSEDKTYHSENIINEVAPPNTLNEITTSLLNDTTILDDEYQANKSDTDTIIDDVFSYINSDINENFKYKRGINNKNRRIEKRNVDLQLINVTLPDNNTDKVIKIQNILFPLNTIIRQKQEEIDKLIDIREKLMTYMKTFSDNNISNSFTNYSNTNITQFYFIQLNSTQNFDEFIKFDLNTHNKYLQKLKSDIQEVVKDIAGIQRLSNDSTIPYDLKLLIRAMKNYVRKDNKIEKIANDTNKNIIDLRKKFNTDISYKTDLKPVDDIIKILEVLDNDMPTSNLLNALTSSTRKILTRLVNRFYDNNITSTELQMNRTYNLTRNLQDIGKQWNEMTIDIATNSLSERLYSMKLFYLVLLGDIEKIKDSLVLLQFAQNRRMTPIDDVTGETLIDRILNDLRKSGRRFNHIIHIQTLRSRVNNTTGHGKKTSKKKSFLQHIKTLLKNYKMDIRKLLHRKVPKSQIVKHIAKKKLDEIRKNKFAEYEQTMQRWQNNLNIISRNKRAAGSFQNFINSIKTIIPGYRRSYRKKGNKTEKIKTRPKKRGSKKAQKITTTTQRTIITTSKQK